MISLFPLLINVVVRPWRVISMASPKNRFPSSHIWAWLLVTMTGRRRTPKARFLTRRPTLVDQLHRIYTDNLKELVYERKLKIYSKLFHPTLLQGSMWIIWMIIIWIMCNLEKNITHERILSTCNKNHVIRILVIQKFMECRRNLLAPLR